MVLNLFKSATKLATETKASAAGPVIAYHSSGRVVWSPRDAVSIIRSGFQGNPVGFRAVKLISEAAAAVPLLLQSAEQRFETHPILTLIGQPNPSQGRWGGGAARQSEYAGLSGICQPIARSENCRGAGGSGGTRFSGHRLCGV